MPPQQTLLVCCHRQVPVLQFQHLTRPSALRQGWSLCRRNATLRAGYSSVRGASRPAGLRSETWLQKDVSVSRGFRSSSNPAELVKPFTAEALERASHMGMLFDCDGVLYAGSQKIHPAKAALKAVKYHLVRYLFLTNGGGTSVEAVKGEDLQRKIQTNPADDVYTGRVIQSHTPFLGWPEPVKENDTVFITSSHPEKAKAVAKAYGFKKVVTSADLLAHHNPLYPFDPPETHPSKALPSHLDGVPIFQAEDPTSYDTESLKRNGNLKIDHVLIWNDPRDWSLDTQIVHDILISHAGYLGTVSRLNGDASLPNNGWQQDGQPRLWMSNLDLVWKTQYHINRFGTGAFLEAFKGVWSAVTDGKDLSFEYMGKPSKLTYDYAHDRLLRDYGRVAGNEHQQHPLKRVYMVGDNPESDIRGALEYNPDDGTEYVPILVRTGVWRQTEREREPKYRPAVIVDDVLDAVVWALRNEGVDADRKTLELEAPSSLQDMAKRAGISI